MLGGIEAGGTKFVCGIGSGPEDILTAEFPTSTPDITVASVIEFFKAHRTAQLDAVGIGSFGPVDLDPLSPTYGHITSTPKAGWENYNLAGAIRGALNVPVLLDTDVNAALAGEARWGEIEHLSDAIYLTIGTGIGGGALVGRQIVHGLLHPEMGHLRLPHDFTADPFPGTCRFHGDCFEGLASGPAMQARWNAPAGTLPAHHPAWPLEARYIAFALVNLTVTLSPQRIVLGGGVMQQSHLFPLIREEFARLMNNYIRRREVIDELDQYIRPPKLGGRAGVLGALVLAQQAFNEACPRKALLA